MIADNENKLSYNLKWDPPYKQINTIRNYPKDVNITRPLDFKEILEDFNKVKIGRNITGEEIAEKYNLTKTPYGSISPDLSGNRFVEWVPRRHEPLYKQKIPFFIVQTWKSNYLEETIFNCMENYIKFNQEYHYFLFSDEKIRKFIELEYGHNILNLYDNLLVGAAKADVFRILFIYFYGGIYADIDHELADDTPFRTWGIGHFEVVAGISNELHPPHQKLLYIPGHIIIKNTVKKTLKSLYEANAIHIYEISYIHFVQSFAENNVIACECNGLTTIHFDGSFNNKISINKECVSMCQEKNGHWQESSGKQSKIFKHVINNTYLHNGESLIIKRDTYNIVCYLSEEKKIIKTKLDWKPGYKNFKYIRNNPKAVNITRPLDF